MFLSGRRTDVPKSSVSTSGPDSPTSARRLPRVTLVAASLAILGGQGVEAHLLINALRRDGYDVDLLPINPRLPRGLGWVRRYRGLRTIVNEAIYLPSLLRLYRRDVIHVFSASYWSFLLAPVPAMVAGRSFRKRVVLHYHSGEAADHLAHWGWLVHPWLRLAHEIVVPSEYLRRIFAAYGYPVVVIPNLVDASHFAFRERRQVQPRLLSTRNLEPYYDVRTTLRAFKLIKQRHPDATLTIVGSGSESESLRVLADSLKLDGVQFVGRVEPSGMPDLCAAADVFLNASVVDNQPVSILEAFAAGLAVVTTPTGAIPEMVEDGRTGVIVPPDDPSAMADAVIRLLEQPDQVLRLTTHARENLRNYLWAALRDSWAEMYDAPSMSNQPQLPLGDPDDRTTSSSSEGDPS